MTEFHEFDVASMARVVCFAKSPVAKGFMTLYTGKRVSELKRSDLQCLVSEAPSMLVLMSVGGTEVFTSLKSGVLEFDKYFLGSDYSIQDMEKTLLSMSARDSVVDFYAHIPPDSFFKTHKKWIVGGAGIISVILSIFVCVHVRRKCQKEIEPSSFSPVLPTRKRKYADAGKRTSDPPL